MAGQTLNPTYLLPPDQAGQYATSQAAIDQQRQLANMLLTQGFKDDSGTQMAGPIAIRKSPFEGLARMFSAYVGKGMNDDSNVKAGQLAQMTSQSMRNQAAGLPAQQPAPGPTQDTGAVVQALGGGGGPTNANAAALGAMLSQGTPAYQPAPQTPPAQAGGTPAASSDAFNLSNLIRGGSIAALGGDAAGNAYWHNAESTPEMKNSQYAGQTPQQFAGQYNAIQTKAGTQSFTPGQMNVLPNGQTVVAPNFETGVAGGFDAQGNPVAMPIPGSQPIAAGRAGAIAGAEAAGRASNTLNQGVDASGNPTYFYGLPPGTTGAPGASAPQGRFSGDPAQIESSILSIHDPKDRMYAWQAYQAQKAGGQGSAPVVRPANAPGFNQYQETTATAAGKRVNDLIDQAKDSPTRINVLDNIMNMSAQGVKTGPTQDWKNTAKGVAADSLGIKSWQNDVSGFQEMRKFLLQNGQRAWQAAGGTGTDSQMDSYMHSNPNDQMFPKALQGMATWAKAGELALQGKANALQAASVNSPTQQAQFESAWRQNMDPRLYQMKLMSPTEAQTYVENLKKTNPADYGTLVKKAQTLKQLGGL